MSCAATCELASSFGSESYTTTSRSRGRAGPGASLVQRTAPGRRTVLCSYGYLRRASTRTGAASLSRRAFRSSLEIRGTATGRYSLRAVVGLSTEGPQRDALALTAFPSQHTVSIFPLLHPAEVARRTMIGKTIGKYRFVEELGRGPLGTVYKALDETLDREVAVKVLNPELTNSELMKHFQTEATTLARLHHSDIATIHEVHRTDTDLLMVMEFVKGETLDHLAERCGPLPPEGAAYLLAQVLGALEHAHNAGVVHRDLTPSSITVTEHGAIKVMDFGMARVAAADQATSDGIALG